MLMHFRPNVMLFLKMNSGLRLFRQKQPALPINNFQNNRFSQFNVQTKILPCVIKETIRAGVQR